MNHDPCGVPSATRVVPYHLITTDARMHEHRQTHGRAGAREGGGRTHTAHRPAITPPQRTRKRAQLVALSGGAPGI